ncbi:hypothetical protein MA16_Dca019912 [Dendrobium catenatum]|uniref:Smr domain-containing protein n=1 Tax=Dendrobium catenatum TaxID=906689 RepID=A0A2I0XEM2_9ASPA|nr:hypothetical protein MA16_Dca019912 [Dendrobium catenatum]
MRSIHALFDDVVDVWIDVEEGRVKDANRPLELRFLNLGLGIRKSAQGGDLNYGGRARGIGLDCGGGGEDRSFHALMSPSEVHQACCVIEKSPLKLKGKFYKMVVRLAMLYDAECCPLKKKHNIKLSVAEKRMLREYLKVPLNTKEQVPSKFGMVNPNLQQKVLESLFNVPEMSCVLNSMSWKEVVKKVESFGQGLEFGFEGVSEPSSGSRVGKEDYHAFRSVAKKNWDTMRSYYHKATLAYARGERAQASYLSEKGKFFKKLAQEADEKASQEIFAARNKGIKNTIVIDLHGQHVKQAIRLLKLHLLLCTYITSVHFLRVITGCGADGVGLGKLKQAVLNLARKEVINCNEENSGTLLLCLEGRRSFTFMESDVDSDENKP